MKKSGFTLIELSIVLVIIGLLTGGSFKVLKIMRERAQISRAHDDVQVAKQAVIGNTILNSNTLPSQAFFDANLSGVKNNQHQLFYADDTALETTNICAVQTTTLKVKTPTKTIDNIAFVVASEGANHNMQTAKINNQVKTYDYAKKVDDSTSPVNIVENYDDVVDWVTLSQLQQEARCQDNQLRIVNTSLPSANAGTTYNVKIVIDGKNYSSPVLTCNFSSSTGANGFTSDSSNFTITNSNTIAHTSTEVDCNVTAQGAKPTSKKFTITVN